MVGLGVIGRNLMLTMADHGIIQINEPALREGLPLRRADWQEF
jgi:5-methyltetrahydropteroyltriglutamate--homocysteine methyltransferase